jgi:hypothetical protein
VEKYTNSDFIFVKYVTMQGSFTILIKLLLPEIIVEYFELISYKKGEEVLHLYLKKINSIPQEFRQHKLSSKGCFDEITVQDFPTRAHQEHLHITRRRWLNEDISAIVLAPIAIARNLAVSGIRVTQEFA